MDNMDNLATKNYIEKLENAVLELHWHYSFVYEQLTFCKPYLPPEKGDGEWSVEDVENCIDTIWKASSKYNSLVNELRDKRKNLNELK